MPYKAAEGRRIPGRWRAFARLLTRVSVLDCARPGAFEIVNNPEHPVRPLNTPPNFSRLAKTLLRPKPPDTSQRPNPQCRHAKFDLSYPCSSAFSAYKTVPPKRRTFPNRFLPCPHPNNWHGRMANSPCFSV